MDDKSGIQNYIHDIQLLANIQAFDTQIIREDQLLYRVKSIAGVIYQTRHPFFIKQDLVIGDCLYHWLLHTC